MKIDKIKQSLLSLPRPLKRRLAFFIDFVICVLSVWLAFGLRLDQWGYLYGKQWTLLLAAIGFLFPLSIFFGLNREIFRYIGSSAIQAITKVFIIYTGIIFFIFTIFRVDGVPRSLGIIQPILLFTGISASRYIAYFWIGGNNNQKTSGHGQSNVLIYGAGSAGRELASGILANNQIFVKGFVDDDFYLQGSTINGVTVYPSKNLQELIHRLNVTDIFLAIPSATGNQRSKIINSLNGLGVRVRTLPRLIDLASGHVRISDIHDLDMNDLLGRAVVPPDRGLLEKNIYNQIVLVTGAGGSIGSELCRQLIKLYPKSLVLIDNSEHALYLIYEELKQNIIRLEADFLEKCQAHPASSHHILPITLVPCLASVRDEDLIKKIWKTYSPSIVFHAAAYKHVPLVEQNLVEGIRNNVFGTITCAKVSLDYGVSHFVLVSTDKAVRPTNIMGASKRIAELVLQAMSEMVFKSDRQTKFSMVRFGNVLGSSGSVAPLFSSQIASGGPITLTHPEVTRFFMTIPEAAQLVIQASAMAEGGDVFVLDMGKPVRIYDLAVKMIYLSGLLIKDENHPHGNIEIKITGLRPGEKLYEELLIGDNPQPTAHPKIMKAHEDFISWDELNQDLKMLDFALGVFDDEKITVLIKRLVPEYHPKKHPLNLNKEEI